MQQQNKSQSYKCYLRTTDMKCKIENVNTNQTVGELKVKINQIMNLRVGELDEIRLVVNQIQLDNESILAEHLHHNAIIHIIKAPKLTQKLSSQQQSSASQFISLKLKQPPIDCPVYTLQNIDQNITIIQLKQKTLQFYRQHHQLNEISQLNESELYLIYGGRVMAEGRKFNEYGYEQNGVIYVVNGRQYVKQMTKEQAERRINEIRQQNNQQITIQEQHQHQQEQQTINIIQNIVFDENDFECNHNQQKPTPKSQKIIKRYDSISRQQIAEEYTNQFTTENEQQKIEIKQYQDEERVVQQQQQNQEVKIPSSEQQVQQENLLQTTPWNESPKQPDQQDDSIDLLQQ